MYKHFSKVRNVTFHDLVSVHNDSTLGPECPICLESLESVNFVLSTLLLNYTRDTEESYSLMSN